MQRTEETHELSIRLHLVESCKPAPCYLVLLPRLATHDSGHLRYSDHRIEVDSAAGVSAVDIESDHFAMYTVQRDALDSLVVRHSWRSHDVALVRKQYGRLNYRTAARTLFLRPYLAHFCPVFSRFFAVFSVLTPGFQKVAPKDRGAVP